jgi:hypothetical protein
VLQVTINQIGQLLSCRVRSKADRSKVDAANWQMEGMIFDEMTEGMNIEIEHLSTLILPILFNMNYALSVDPNL